MSDAIQLEAADIELFRDSVKKFIAKEIEPYYAQWEKDELVPRDLWHTLGQHGLLCIDTPAKYGGNDAPFELACIVIEEISKGGYGALAGSLSVHSDIVAPYILHLGDEQQKNYWLPKLASGEVVGAIAMTEPGAGSDLQGMQTKAVANENGYAISGQKTFISNGQHAGLVIVAAKTDANAGSKGVTLFNVDTRKEGFARGRNLEKIGHHCGDTSELFFDNVQVSEKDILGGKGLGFKNLMNELPRERLILAVGAIGACEGMLDWTIDYVSERKAFAQPIAQFQNTRFKIAELATQVKINKVFIENCNALYQAGKLDAVTASQAKLSTTELQGRVADECLQLFGGYGYMQEYPISRAYVDARIQRIYGGTSEIMKEIIARDLLGR